MPSSAIPDSPRSVWVVGSGGFLGGAVAEQLERDGRFHAFQPRPHLEWSAPDFTSAIDAFQAHTSGMPWTVVWAAGAATVNSSEPEARDEAMSFREFLDQLRLRMNLRVGTVILASSAGGVYAGSHQSVISINTPAATASPYGRLKVEQEELVRSLEDDGLTVRIVRITNLFGPRHNARKPQGIVHHLARAALTREPISIYVPLSTARDYVYVEDAAETLCRLLIPHPGASAVSIDILGSGRAITLAALIALVEGVAHRRVPYALSASTSDHPGDLRFRPTIIADRTSLESGIRRTLDQLAHVPR